LMIAGPGEDFHVFDTNDFKPPPEVAENETAPY
jgi:hypothetical protein